MRFDVNTSPLPPDLRDVLAGPFDPLLSEYPPSDYAGLVAAAAESYGVAPDEILPTAGADEALDLTARAFLREGSAAVGAVPTYAMYGIVTEQRGAQLPSRVAPARRRGLRAGHSGAGRGRARRRPGLAVRAEQPDRHRGAAGANRRAAGPAGSRRGPSRPSRSGRGRRRGLRRVRRPLGAAAARPVPAAGRHPDPEQGPRPGRGPRRLRRRAAGNTGADPLVPRSRLGFDRLRGPGDCRAAPPRAGRGQRRPHRGAACPPHRRAARRRLASVSLAGQLHPGPLRVCRRSPPRPPRRCCARASSREHSAPIIRWPTACA